MATDRVSRRTGLRLHRAGIPEKGLGAAPLGAPDPHLNCRTPSSFPPQPRPPARPLALGGPSEDGGGGGGFLRGPPSLTGGRDGGGPRAPGTLEPPRSRPSPRRLRRTGSGGGSGRAWLGSKSHLRGRCLAPGSVRKRKSAARGGAGARLAGAGPRRAPRGPPWPRTSWPAS